MWTFCLSVKTLLKSSLILSVILIFMGLHFASFADQTESVVRGLWKENKTISLKGKQVIVPTYLPYEDIQKPIKYYWATEPDSAHWPNYLIDFSKVSDCNGAHVCSHASFAVSSISKDTAGFIEDMLGAKYEYVQLAPFIDGYYVPSVCYAYCTTVKLVWFVPGKMFIIAAEGLGNSKSDIAELKKSALTVINQYPIVKER